MTLSELFDSRFPILTRRTAHCAHVAVASSRGSYDDFHFVGSGLCKYSSLVGVVWEVWNGLSFDPI